MIKVASVPDFLPLLCPVAHFIPSGCPLGALHLRLLSFPTVVSHFRSIQPLFLECIFLCLVKVPPVKCSFTFVEHSYRVARYNYINLCNDIRF